LVLSQIAQKAIFEKIKAEDPELVSMRSRIEQGVAIASLEAREIEVGEETEQPLKEVPQPVPVPKTKKPLRRSLKKRLSV
jgi:hypothetical protein